MELILPIETRVGLFLDLVVELDAVEGGVGLRTVSLRHLIQLQLIAFVANYLLSEVHEFFPELDGFVGNVLAVV